MNQALTATQTFFIDSAKKQKQGGSRIAAHSAHFRPRPVRSVDDEKSSFELSAAVGMEILEPMPQSADQTVLVYTHIEMPAQYDHVPMGYMNRTNWIPQEQPLIDLPRAQWDEHQLMPAVEATGDWVDIVVNNIDDKGHPFHLVKSIILPSFCSWLTSSVQHGHDFYVLTRHAFPRRAGYRTYNPYDPASASEEADLLSYPKPNMENPPLKDTIHIPRRGYVILRIRAENIGLWFFHCHITWHSGTGMAMGLDIR
jgi:FtsP/CotA-like multicopper oxidase with cupredoxin domain